jgi:hypothetical protein
LAITASQPLSGTYTVGGAGSDFSNMTAAISALSCGMTGDVTFNVNPGTYTDAVSIGGYNNPTNAKLTIQANPNNPGTVEFTSAYASTNFNFALNAANNVTLRGLKITGTGTASGRFINYAGSNTNIVIENCEMVGNGTSSQYGIFYANSTTTDKLVGTIRNNTITGAYYGVYLNLNTGDYHKVVKNNITAAYYGVYAYGRTSGGAVAIDSNNVLVTATGGGGYGIYVYGGSTTLVGRALIRSNRVRPLFPPLR